MNKTKKIKFLKDVISQIFFSLLRYHSFLSRFQPLIQPCSSVYWSIFQPVARIHAKRTRSRSSGKYQRQIPKLISRLCSEKRSVAVRRTLNRWNEPIELVCNIKLLYHPPRAIASRRVLRLRANPTVLSSALSRSLHPHVWTSRFPIILIKDFTTTSRRIAPGYWTV